ncbi:MAG: NADH-quinone oxidoreductase subunit L [Rickettsiales bacterium]|nr:NADH-quinone oxidoreductase subunit L [Rickettsiales bacterium]
MNVELYLKLVVFLPLFSAVLIGLQTRIVPDRVAQLVTSGLLVASGLLSARLFHHVYTTKQSVKAVLAPWISSGDLTVSWTLSADMLTVVMLIVVTWVSSVVHIYSIGYMSHDHHKPRFMAYLSLFTFFMLMLVTADNFVQVFLGWEGVGLASYLLIGFWYDKPSANAAAMKAFLVNRVGDVGLAMGIALIFMTFGSLEFSAVFAKAASLQSQNFTFFGYDVPLLDLACLLLFVGCMGKSAQLLLHTWLPDAMEGPTPVSALIHAATMVTAGVFLVARCSPLFELAPTALMVVTVVGAVTAFFAATVGMVQNDIKRVIAYSTCSQLGYMFFACGVSAYAAGIFHLMTHAFFKALLFLGAGSVIHAMSNEQDMRRMGGIWKLIPFTYALIWIGSLALAGIPPFAGFYSKDIVLESVYASHTSWGMFAFAMGIIAAFLTAFYSGRLIFMTFHGKPRASQSVMSHIHESPAVMLLPLLLLAAGAIAAGYIGASLFGMVEPSGDFWNGAIFVAAEHKALEHAHHVPAWVKLLPLVMGVAGLVFSYVFYVLHPALPGRIAGAFSGLYRFLLNKWYFDELYERIFIRPALWLGQFLWKQGDENTIDRFGPNGIARLTQQGGGLASQLQSGYLFHYAFAMMLGLLAIITWFVYTTGIWRS